ncbi:MAG: KR domain-containing protein, partial [Proteobacteria bacterium]|nr:KR domain-containing protein [Pseudomonadota bacterium]
IHAAGIIRDNFIIKKTKEEFEKVLEPKVAGLTNLDEASKHLQLDFFVMFSSFAGAVGNTGQADYACANAFMDAYAGYRNDLVKAEKRKGKTLSINWPLWKEGGMGVDEATEKKMVQSSGILTMQTETGFRAFYHGISLDHPRVMVAEGMLARMRRKLTGVKSEKTIELPDTAPGTDVSLLFDKVKRMLVQDASKLLKVTFEDIDTESELNEYGFDSITLTEFADRLNEKYRLELSPALFFEYSTIESLAKYLINEHQTIFAAQFAAGTYSKISDPVTVEVADIPLAKKRHSRFTAALSAPRHDAFAPEPVAIVGISGKFPMAKDMEEFWNNLAEGKHCITEIPEDRWDWKALYGDPSRDKNKTDIKWGGFIDGIGDFDPMFFGISPREAEMMDPQQRLLMLYAWKAIEDAGCSAAGLSGTQTGIFVGTGPSGYSEQLISKANVPIEGYTSMGMVPSIGPNRMSYFLDIHGPSEPIETACSSSLVAIHRAVAAMESGNCEMAIAGGINTIITPDLHISFNKAGMLCKDGKCKTFSDKADGYVRGEGVGMLFLKKLGDAKQSGDHIYGVIRGTAENHGGRANFLTAPNPKAQAELLKKAYKKAGIDPRTIGYIEAHGTGTELGDPIEIEGLKAAFKEMYRTTGASGVTEAHCGLGSVKTNIGHTELAAGVAGVIKVLLQMKHKTIVKSLHCDTVNPYIKLEGSPFYIVKESQEWKALQDSSGDDIPRRAGVSSFGFGGANA